MIPQWATVTSVSPLRVRVDGAASPGPALAPMGATLAVNARILVQAVGRTLVVINRYS